ncbi:hypothetical protein QA645_17010 [Bradyrhizobium sp. CIAT3101]|uniref:hypothetical protein n=1 Tax=Bradyrhizobium sp. CIAT3101 TaxID=439387 RepID=UPI0024B1EE83|nr:hypothetical protein [Bradyrhizobium sp. CIAT3101]WFU84372.1 hypothetical protein QA645_17010 [Bradyrhizobium sp. CIAT3101]
MAFSGVHVSCGYAGYNKRNIALLAECKWSQSMATAGTTTNASPVESEVLGAAVFSITATLDIYFAIGTNPDATNGPRRFLQMNTSMDVFAKREGGEYLAWIAA